MAVLIACLGMLLPTAGCDGRGRAERDPANPAGYCELTLTKASGQPEIVEEVARLEAAGMTLESPALAGSTAGIAGLEADKLAFAEQFPADELRSVYHMTAAVYPRGAFEFRPTQLQAASQLRQSHDALLTRFRRYLKQEHAGFGLDPREGLLADLSMVDVVRAAHRLEALEAALLLERGQLDPALDRLSAMLTITARLDDLAHVVPRLTAAELRGEASYVAEAIALHKSADERSFRRLSDMIEALLASWPDDKLAWIGDRALGLHAYEMVRDGHLRSLLTDEELTALAKRGKLFEVAAEIASQVDSDQLFYLNAMRRLIAACDEPYPQRRAVLAEIEQQLAALRATPEYPSVAGQILLKNQTQAHHHQVVDRAVWQALAHLLQHRRFASGEAASEPATGERANPLTGEPLEVVAEADRLVLRLDLLNGQVRELAIGR